VILNRVFLRQISQHRLRGSFTRTRIVACIVSSLSPATAFPDIVREPDMWERAQTIAVEMLDGRLVAGPRSARPRITTPLGCGPGGCARDDQDAPARRAHFSIGPRAWGDGVEAPEMGRRGPSTIESTRRARRGGEEALIGESRSARCQHSRYGPIVARVNRGLRPSRLSPHISISRRDVEMRGRMG